MKAIKIVFGALAAAYTVAAALRLVEVLTTGGGAGARINLTASVAVVAVGAAVTLALFQSAFRKPLPPADEPGRGP